MAENWDCIVVGGGAAGLSAALVLGRARRRTLVVDAGRPSNAVAHGIGGLLGHDGRAPAELYELGRAELARYPTVEVRTGEVVSGRTGDGTFSLTLDDGRVEAAKRVLLASGMDYRHVDRPGVAERWGRSVFHCPFCHGWEVRDQALGVLDPGPMGAQRALMLTMWSDHVTLYTDGPADLDPVDAARLAAAEVPVEERAVAALTGPGDELAAIVLADGTSRPCGGLLLPVTLHQRSPLAAQLGAATEPPGMIAADAVSIGPMFATSVPGLFAAGDLGAAMPSVANAVAAGSNAAAAIVHSLIEERHPSPAG
ncbi:NAD(P)/FAD-dependent oxidoreductase [Aquihabitans daechungensis]|uniref:NAD(P)/FAD-dependent oxidoreductase n=1 Tax=Aquihabitans daechungensis TaxID=1052257 RepID=UPI003B9FF25F